MRCRVSSSPLASRARSRIAITLDSGRAGRGPRYASAASGAAGAGAPHALSTISACAAATADDFALLLYRREDGGEDPRNVVRRIPRRRRRSPHRGWHEAGDPDEVDELLFPFIVLAGELPEKGEAPVPARGMARSRQVLRRHDRRRHRRGARLLEGRVRNPPQDGRAGHRRSGATIRVPAAAGRSSSSAAARRNGCTDIRSRAGAGGESFAQLP